MERLPERAMELIAYRWIRPTNPTCCPLHHTTLIVYHFTKYIFILLFLPVPDPCAAEPCKNRGECTKTGETTFSCKCVDAYEGETCETRKYFFFIVISIKEIIKGVVSL